ncbi:MAG: PQQ-binding-like beta-propeller repeat protein [Thermoguttaceae bacterium]|nr:PQQ-binding-like beta-propeller repeat protein [Thermoguttaceae bacterium]MDW8036577.1 PQQ-binding-like beta-propeller repeat protein [Thermoguttaceae bacterium]
MQQPFRTICLMYLVVGAWMAGKNQDTQTALLATPAPLTTAERVWMAEGELVGNLASADNQASSAKTPLAHHSTGSACWPRFRGPNGQGQAETEHLPVQWTEQDYLWKLQLPGSGHSSPVVCGSRLLITAAQEDGTLWLVCVDARQGKILWQKNRSLDRHHLHPYNSYASSTPAVDKDRVYWAYAQPKRYLVEALRLQDGQLIWQTDLGPFESEHGFGASPIVAEDLVIAANEQDGQSSIIALEAQSGRVRWQCPRRSEKTAYATPCIYRPSQGPPQVITVSWAHGPSGIDLQTGKPLWELPILKYRVVGSPVVVGDIVFCACGVGGVGKQMIAVRPGNPATGTKAELLYEVPLPVPYVCTPVARGNLLFAWADKGGIVTCLEAATGKILWREKLGGDYFSSPILVGNRLYNISRDGQMVVLAAENEFKLLARFPLGEGTHATPAVANGIMYIRTHTHLLAIAGPKSHPASPAKHPAKAPSP